MENIDLDMYQPNFSGAGDQLPMSHPNYGQQPSQFDNFMNMPTFRPGMQQAPVFGGDSAYFNQSQQYPMYSQDNMVSKGQVSSRAAVGGLMGAGGMHPQIKQEMIDPAFEDLEFDGGSRSRRSQPPAGSSSSSSRPRPQPPQKGVDADEDLESGFAESMDQQGPNPSTNVGDHPAEAESRATGQALVDRQQAAFQVCERMFNALLAWATTRDVRYLLAAQRSLTAVQNQQGDTALHLAIIHNHQDVVLQLLDVLPQLPPTETPVVDCLNNLKQSPLHLAVLTRQHKVIQYLLKANANPLVCDREGNTPLHLACRMGFIQGAVTMLNRTNHINAEGCRIPEVHIRNSNGDTPLHLAAKNGCTDALKLLVDAKADVDVQDSKSGKTALHHAVENEDLPMVGYLVTEANCNKDCCDFSGNTPLHVAAGLGRSAITSLLIAAGADVSIQNQEGETPRMHAEYGNHDDVAKVLREAVEMESVNRDEEQLSSQMESVSIKQESDMRQLDFRVRISLAILLDQNDNWRQLCRLMNLSSLESGFATFSSPTKEVLAMFEACEGSIAQLRQFLLEMNRHDAVNIIDHALAQQKSEKSSRSNGEGSSTSQTRMYGSDPVITRGVNDSGIASQSASEELGSHIGTRAPATTEAPSFPSLQVAHTQA